jgi:hypothetical protein
MKVEYHRSGLRRCVICRVSEERIGWYLPLRTRQHGVTNQKITKPVSRSSNHELVLKHVLFRLDIVSAQSAYGCYSFTQ